ncbi:AraC family transcriptional regulator [Paenibacillus sp. MBLB4367]|uniref:AraC family transcriptional regulator n=1 Tax=Paenibacillus sp. MBLB4367 TaxID=3384767 RepID=UPI0039080D47
MESMFALPNLYSAIRIPGMEYARREAGWSYPNHRHPYFEFLCCIEGEIKQWVNGQPIVLNPGDAVMIQSDVYHRTETSVDCRYFDFHFEVEIDEIDLIFQLAEEPVIRVNEHAHVYRWVKQFLTRFGERLGTMGADEPAAKKADDLKKSLDRSVLLLNIHSSLLEGVGLLTAFLLNAGRSGLLSSKAKPSQIRLAREAACLIEEREDERVSIAELARQLNVHRTHLHQCFKTVYGVSPSDYAQQKRLREAKHMLQTTSWSIEEIGHRLRFSSTAHFSRMFRSMAGISPLQFRNHEKGRDV